MCSKKMDFFFADDARQKKPSRKGMGPLVAIGGIGVPGKNVHLLERAIEDLCVNKYGFPVGEEFKWSPGRDLWMHDNLIGEKREKFFVEVLDLLRKQSVSACIILEDTNYRPATDWRIDAETDVVRLLLERIDSELVRIKEDGIVVGDRPTGGRTSEDKFLTDCLKTLRVGTEYVKPKRIVFNVLSCPSKFIRLLQAADLVTSCSLARVSGEQKFSLSIFNKIKKLFMKDGDRIGGYGLKMHPDYRYANLYHWLAGDNYFYKMMTGVPMPMETRPYHLDEWTP